MQLSNVNNLLWRFQQNRRRLLKYKRMLLNLKRNEMACYNRGLTSNWYKRNKFKNPKNSPWLATGGETFPYSYDNEVKPFIIALYYGGFYHLNNIGIKVLRHSINLTNPEENKRLDGFCNLIYSLEQCSIVKQLHELHHKGHLRAFVEHYGKFKTPKKFSQTLKNIDYFLKVNHKVIKKLKNAKKQILA